MSDSSSLAALAYLGGFKKRKREKKNVLASNNLPQNADVFRVTVLIPAHNEALYIRDTLEGVLNQDDAEKYISEIIVIDDASTDDTAAIALETARRWNARYIMNMRVRVLSRKKYNEKTDQETDKNGKAYGLEAGLAEVSATSQAFLTVDGDSVLERNCLKLLVAAVKKPHVACASGKVFPRFVRTIWELARWFEYGLSFRSTKLTQDQFGFLMVSPGCCSIFRTDTVRKFGGFKGTTFAEDMELTIRLIMGGWDVAYVPDAVCRPVEPNTLKRYSNQLDRWYRGFFQCLRVFQDGSIWRINRFWKKDKRLAAFAIYYAMGVLLVPLLTPLYMYMFWNLTSGIQATILWSLIFKFLLEWRYVLAEGMRQGSFWTALLSIPSSVFVGQPLGIYLFIRAFIRESRGDKLVWIKCREESLEPTNELIGVRK
jgi:cellulose synthase/poly-beta-1,6-N-acetylglucosamine synthase-like glycosyltransferase